MNNTICPTRINRPPSSALEALFRPQGVALMCESGNPSTPTYQVLSNLLEAGFPGHLSLITPTGSPTLGISAYPDLLSVPNPVEMLITMVPASYTPMLAEAIRLRSAQRGDLRVVLVLNGGFAETGHEQGAAWQQMLTEVCDSTGVRLVGPNCMGIIDNRSRLDTSFFAGFHRQASGISLLSQSGSMGAWMAQEWSARPVPVGLNKFINLGNMADITMAEVLEYLGRDSSTRVVGVYLEGDPGADKMLRAAQWTASRKPVVMLKCGRTAPSSIATMSHVAVLPGTDPLYHGAFQELGLIRATRVTEFASTLNAFDKLPLPLGPRVAVLTNAAGPGIYTLDALGQAGLRLARLSPASRTILSKTLPPLASIGRPDGHVDMTGTVAPRQVVQSLATVLRDPGVDTVVMLFLNNAHTPALRVAEEMLSLLPGLKRNTLVKPLFPVLLSGQNVAEARRLLETNKIPTFTSPDHAVAALAAMVQYSLGRTSLREPQRTGR